MKKTVALLFVFVLILASVMPANALLYGDYAYEDDYGGEYNGRTVILSANEQTAVVDGEEYVFLDVGNFVFPNDEYEMLDVTFQGDKYGASATAKRSYGEHPFIEILIEEHVGNMTVITNKYYVKKSYYNEAYSVAVGEGEHYAMASYYSDHFGNISAESIKKITSAVPSRILFSEVCETSNIMELYSTDETNSFYTLYGKVITLYNPQDDIDLGSYILLYSDCDISKMYRYDYGYDIGSLEEVKMYPVADKEMLKTIDETIKYTPDDGLADFVYQGASDTFTKASTIVVLGIVPFIIGLLCLIFGIKKWKGVYKKVAFTISGCMLVEIVCYIVVFANIGF